MSNVELEKVLILLTLKLYHNLLIPRNVIQLLIIILSDFIKQYFLTFIKQQISLIETDPIIREKINRSLDAALSSFFFDF